MLDTHCEKNLIINGRDLKYKGIFQVTELFSTINRAIEEKGYLKQEKKTEELVTVGGKKTSVELRPYKEKTRYITLMIKMRITLDHITEVVEEIDGEKKKFQKGDVDIIFDAWTLSDYEERWGMSPVVYFLKGFINKFIYTFPMEAGFTGELGNDTAFIYGRIKKVLNSYRHETSGMAKEDDVRKKVSQEMEKELMEERAE